MSSHPYGIWLSFNNQEKGFQLPVNPPTLEISESGSGKTYDIGSLGEINVIKSPQLTEISFSSEFPMERRPYVVSEKLFDPAFYVLSIKEWLDSKRPIRLVLAGLSININMAVSIEKFSWKESAGSVGDIEYDLSFKKYKFYSAQRTSVKPESTGAVLQKETPNRPDDRSPVKSYKLVAGDNLWRIAQQVLGDGSRYKEIQKLNNLSDAQLKALPIGMEIKLP